MDGDVKLPVRTDVRGGAGARRDEVGEETSDAAVRSCVLIASDADIELWRRRPVEVLPMGGSPNGVKRSSALAVLAIFSTAT